MTATPPSLLEVRRLAVAAPDDPATALVKDIDWSIRAGEFWVVVGGPGSGKSQLLETLLDLTPPHAGDVALMEPPGAGSALPGSARSRRLGLVFAEGGRLFGDLTVAENIGLALCYHRACRFEAVTAEVERVLVQTGLSTWADTLPSRLNGALRQRAALARALALEPDVLLLDNALSGLGLAQARWWLDFLPRLLNPDQAEPRRPAAIVVATDDLRPWLSVGTDFALLHAGQWRPVGKRAEVTTSDDPVVREWLNADLL